MKNKILFTLITLILLVGIVTATITNNGDGTHTISYTVSTDTAIEMKEAICHNYKYQEYLEDENMDLYINPESCSEFSEKRIKEFIKNNIVAYRHDIAQKQAKETINNMEEPEIS